MSETEIAKTATQNFLLQNRQTPILVFSHHFMATKVKKAQKAASKKLSAKAKPAIRKPVAPKKVRYVYYFGDGKADGDGKMKPLLGGKGANLAEMTRIGLPVPPGFTITTEVCSYYYDHKRQYPPELSSQVDSVLAKIEKSVGKKLGDLSDPLLLSV